jgi:hypothetical protein
MDGTTFDTHTERNLECLIMSSDIFQKLIHKTRRGMGRNADLFFINGTPRDTQPVVSNSLCRLVTES